MKVLAVEDDNVARSILRRSLERLGHEVIEARDGEAAGAGEPFYAEVTDWRAATGLSVRERLAAEFAERFAIDHLAMDEEFWGRLHEAFSEAELADLTICCGCFLGMGRAMAVVGVRAPDERILV